MAAFDGADEPGPKTSLREKIYEEHRKIFDILLLGLTPDFELRVFYDRHLGSYREGFQEILERYQGYFESKE